MNKFGRRDSDEFSRHLVSKWDDALTYITRAVILAGLSWLIWTTDTNTKTLMLLEWRVMQVEVHMKD